MRTAIRLFLLAPLAACATGGATHKSLAGPGANPPASAPRPDTTLQRIPQRNERVRVVFPATATQPQRYVSGHLQRLTTDTAVIAHGLVMDTVALGGGRQLQAVVRSRGRTWSGVAIGVFAGGTLGGILASAAYKPCTSTEFFGCLMYPSQGMQTAGGFVLGGLLGGVIGGAIGGGMRTEEWGTVPITRTRVSVRPAQLSVSVRF